jgi:WD40 repeat protein
MGIFPVGESVFAVGQLHGADPRTGFVGRSWLLDLIADWLASSSRMLVVTGPAGTGKSAIAARLSELGAHHTSVQIGAGDERASNADSLSALLSRWLVAVQFCSADADETRSATRFVEMLSAQLAVRLSGFAAARENAIASRPGRPISIVGHAHAGSVTGWNVGAFVQLPTASTHETADLLLRQPLHALDDLAGSRGGPVVLVDALDEALGFESTISLPAMIGSLGDTGLRFLITTRPDRRVLDRLPATAERLDLRQHEPTDIGDVRDYVTLRLEGLPNSRLGDLITSRADGNFLYARHVLDDLQHPDCSDRLKAALADPSSLRLPADLADIYRGFLTRELRRNDTPQAAREWSALYQPLLESLCAALDPGLTPSQLAGVLPGDPTTARVRNALEHCRQYLEPTTDRDSIASMDPNTVAWRIYHQSFREYLLMGDDRITDLAEAHAGLADGLYAEHRGAWESADIYATRHTLTHHVAALEAGGLPRKRRDRLNTHLVELADDPGYLVTRIQREGPSRLLDEARRCAAVIPSDEAGHIRDLIEVLIREAGPLAEHADAGASFVSQQLHNAAFVLGAEHLAAIAGSHLDNLRKPHARLRWRAGSDPHLVVILTGHTGGVLALAVLPDGRVVSGGVDNKVRVWDPIGGADSVELAGHTGVVGKVAVLSDGRIASCSKDDTVRVWTMTGNHDPVVVTGHPSPPDQYVADFVVLSGDRMASASSDGTIQVWDATGETPTILLTGHSSRVTALSGLADGRLASASSDGTVRVWDPSGSRETMILSAHARDVMSLELMHDGRLAAGYSDGSVRLWDLTGRENPVVLTDHGAGIISICALSNGRIATGSLDHFIRVWDLTSKLDPVVLTGHTDWVHLLTDLPDGRLASASADGTVRIWDPSGDQGPVVLTGHTRSVNALAALPDGQLATGSSDGTVRLWSLMSRTDARVLPSHSSQVTALLATADGRLASASMDTTVRLWEPTGSAPPVVLTGHTWWVRNLAGLRDGRLASCSWDGTVRLWDLAGDAEPLVLGHTSGDSTGWLDLVVELADGRLAVAHSGSSSSLVRVWDPADPISEIVLRGHEAGVNALLLLPDARLASASDDHTVRVWTLPSRTQRPRGHRRIHSAVLSGHTGAVTSLAVLPDGRLASASKDHTLRLWDLAEDTELEVLSGHTGAITTLALFPDGRLVSASADGTLRVWTITGRDSVELRGHTAPVTAAAILPDGRLASSADDGTMRIWDPSGGTLILVACPSPSALEAGDSLYVGHANGWVSAYEITE